MSITKLAIKFAAPLPKIEDYNTYLFIGPHPDDIEIGAGATAAKLAYMGKRVTFLICMDGRYGGSAASEEELIEIRRAEAQKSAEMLGVSDVRFLNLCDGGFYSEEELLSAMAKVIGDDNPDVIFAPDPDTRSECHPDHLNVGRCAKRLAYFAPYEGIMARYSAAKAGVKALCLYMTARPNRYVNTSGFLTQQLASVFEVHRSQFPRGYEDGKSIALYIKLRAFDFGIHALCRTAEGFRVMGETQMHCLPEAGL